MLNREGLFFIYHWFRFNLKSSAEQKCFFLIVLKASIKNL